MPKPPVSLATRFGPETRRWIRCVDAVMVLLVSLGIAGVLFLYRIEIELRLLKTVFYGSLICTPIISFMLYRESNLNRLERIAIIGLVLCLGLALLIASIESARTP